MQKSTTTPLVLITASLALGFGLASLSGPILLTALLGGIVAIALALRLAFGRLWRDLTIMRSVLAGRSNLPTAMVHSLITGAAVQGLVFASLGHLVGQLLVWPDLGLTMGPADFDQITVIGLIGVVGNFWFRRQKAKALR